MYKIRKELGPDLPQIASKSRRELSVMLAKLDEAIPRLIAQNPDNADFMPLFAHRADVIAMQADAVDHQWLIARVDGLLEKNGMLDEEYLLPHNL
jgi:hypothetical protein